MASPRTVRAAIREWMDPKGFMKAMERHSTAGQAPPPPVGDQPYEVLTTTWLDLESDRAREERPASVAVKDGEQWWLRHEKVGLRTSEGGGVANVAQTLRQWLNPKALLDKLDLEADGDRTVAGRAGLVHRGPAKAGQEEDFALAVVGWHADSYEVVVDAETGMLLAYESIIDGEPFRTGEVIELALDEDFDDALFAPLTQA